MKISQRIRSWLQEGEDILTSLLGLIIAISGLIAFADVFSNGRALAYLPWLLWVWIISQAIAVDYMFYIAVKRQFTASNVEPFVYWSRWALIAILGALVVFVGAIFTVNETQGGAIATSMQVLGIPSIAFMYARAAAPVLLLFVIGIDHALDRKEQPAPAVSPDVLNVLIERLDELHVTVTQLVSSPVPELPERSAGRAENDHQISEPIYRPRFESKELVIKDIMQRQPGATAEEVAQAAGCTVRTAAKWIEKLGKD
jgi:hypothetical protein